MYRLLMLTGKLKGKRITVQQGNLLIGRGSDCHINLDDDEQVSPHHAMIEHRGGRPVIKVLGGAHHILVNGRPASEQRLRHGDQIEVGGSRIEFSESGKSPVGTPRRFSFTEAFAVLAIGFVLLMHILLMLVFPLWQKKVEVDGPLAPPVESPEPAPAESVTLPAPEPGEPAVVSEAPVADPPVKPAAVTELEGPVPMVIPENQLPPDAMVDPLLSLAKTMLHDARKQIALMNYAQAESNLHRAQEIAPEFTPVIIERAELFEKRRMFAEALHLREELLTLTEGTAEHAKAVKEKERVARQLAMASEEKPAVIAEPAGSKPATIASPEAFIQILSVDRERFRETGDYDELRVVRITLRRGDDRSSIVARDVLVTVDFFDRTESAGEVVPTGALVNDEGLEVIGTWPPGEVRTVTATYMVPKGFRAAEKQQLGEARSYHGYRIKVYYKNELQDQSSMPKNI